MATLTAYQRVDMSNDFIWYGEVNPKKDATPTHFQIESDNRLQNYYGNFTYNASGFPTGGILTSSDYYLSNVKQYELSGGNYKLLTVFSLLSRSNTSGLLNYIFAGNDTFQGSSADDVLYGYTGSDQLFGNGGNDTLNGGAGADNLTGGAGDDIYFVDNAGDVVTEQISAGIDLVNSTITIESLSANVENLTLLGSRAINGNGNELANIITGNSAANTLNGGQGNDTLIGDNGNDTYFVDSEGDVVNETLAGNAGGIDLIWSSVTYTLGDNQENLNLTGANLISGYGNELANIIIGNKVSNLLVGGLGKDILKGGDGNDEYHVNLIKYGKVARLEDTVIENKNEGIHDKLVLIGEIDLLTATTLTLGNNLEDFSAENTVNTKLNLTGNALDNDLIGNDADNILNGGLGADTLHGGKGNDIYLVDNIGDTISENLNAGADLVKVNIAVASGTYQVTDNVENATLISTVAYNLIGNSLDNTLIGNRAANTLTGGKGADLLIGGIGKDSYDLTESTQATDTVQIAAGDSLVSSFDVISGFKLGNSQGADQLNLPSTSIAPNATINGADKGVIHSHQITDGMITFDDVNSFSDALDITSSNFANVLSYLQANIRSNNTVSFISEGNTYVFQDGGTKDTLLELVGVSANSLNSTDLAADTLWIV